MGTDRFILETALSVTVPSVNRASRLSKVPVKPHYRIGPYTSQRSMRLSYEDQEGIPLYPRPYRPPTPRPAITGYESANAFLGNRKLRALPGRSTVLESYVHGAIAVRYHATDVVTYQPNGDIILDSGGWRTHTTKDRLNEYGPRNFYVQQRKYDWFLRDMRRRGQGVVEYPFHDGITIHPDGTVT